MTREDALKYEKQRVNFKTDASPIDSDLPTGGVGLVWWVDRDSVLLEAAPYHPGRGWVTEKLRIPLRRLTSLEPVA